MNKTRFEPEEYLPNRSDPRYIKQEIRFAIRLIFGRKNRRSIKGAQRKSALCFLNEKEARAHFYLESIRDGQTLRGEALSFTKEAEDCAIQAIQIFGIDALRLSGPDQQIVNLGDEADIRFNYLDTMDRLGCLICVMIRSWKDCAISANLTARREATARLKMLAAALVPDNRGRVAVDDFDVLYFYYTELFRLYHIRRILVTPRANRKHGGYADRVRCASEAFDLPVSTIRELWCLDEDDEPSLTRPTSMKDMARILTDRHFGIAQHTLSNIIARFP
jgi:hypothetical protein